MVHEKNFPFHNKDIEDDFVHVSRSGLSFFGKFIITLVFVGTVGAAGFFGYNHFKPKSETTNTTYSQNGLPLIKADTAPYKSEPLNPGGMQIPNLDKQIYNKVDKTMGFAIDGVEENLDTIPNKDELINQLVDQQSKNEQIQGIINRKNAVPTPAKPQTEAEVKAKRIDVDKVLAKKEPAEIWIQLGTFEEEADATKAWQDVREKNADALADVGTRVTKSEADGGIYYRLQSGPIYSEDDAKALCAKLSARGQSCFYATKGAQ